MIFKSIKLKVFFLYYFSTILLFLFVSLGIYFEIKNALEQSMSETLNSKMQILLGLLHEERGEIEFEVNKTIYGEYSIPRSGHYYKIVMNNKKVVYSPSLVSPDFKLWKNINENNLYNIKGPNNEEIEVLYKEITISGTNIKLAVAENLEENDKILHKLRLFLFFSIFITSIIIAFLAVNIIRYSIKPLKDFSDEVNSITYESLEKRINSEDKVKELRDIVVSFNNMLERIEKSFQLEKLIISEASHQLKTPITIIKTYCDITLQNKRTIEEYIDSLNEIREVSNGMGNLAKNLLTLAKIDSAKGKSFSKISINECIDTAINISDILINSKNIILEKKLEDNIFIYGDKEKFTELLINLVDNSIKYNKQNGKIVIDLFKKEDKCYLIIADNGIGIKEEDLKHIFERFYRGSNSSYADGSGLGLSIVKSIINMHHGHLKVESKVGVGTSFEINLPLFEHFA